MRLKKTACALLLGGSLSMFNVGCSAVNALVHSPAGQGAATGSAQRIAAIGRVFENQGRYTQARAMYQQALKADPQNTTARDRLTYLATLGHGSMDQQAVSDPISIADAVTKPRSRRSFPTVKLTTPPASAEPEHKAEIRVVRAFDTEGTVQSAGLSVGGEFEDAFPKVVAVTETSGVQPEVVEWNIDPVESPAVEDIAIETTGRTTFDTSTELVAEVVTEFEPINVEASSQQEVREELVSIEQVDADEAIEYTGPIAVQASQESDRVINPAEGPWRPARQITRLEDVLAWSDKPSAHVEDLIDAIDLGADEGVQALAVALLGEISSPHQDILSALNNSAKSGAPIVRAAAFDALVMQGLGDADAVDGLLSLLAGDDPGVRAQAAATLHRLVETQWRDDAIEGLHRLLNDTNDEVVAIAATSLSEFGSAAVFCRDRLTAVAAATSSELVLEATSMALSRIPRTAPE